MLSVVKITKVITASICPFYTNKRLRQKSDFVQILHDLKLWILFSELKHEFEIAFLNYVLNDEELGLRGSIDMLGFRRNEVHIYELKIGKVRRSDMVQLLLYMIILQRKFPQYNIVGHLIYNNTRSFTFRLNELPSSLIVQLGLILNRIAKKPQLLDVKVPGPYCHQCDCLCNLRREQFR